MTTTSVLVVNDGLVCWALRRELAAHGVPVRTATSAAEARTRFGEQVDTLLFIGNSLPDADGLDLLEDLHREAPASTFVILSDSGAPELKERAFAGGASQFIEKPFGLGDILRIVDSVTQTYDHHREGTRRVCHLPLSIKLETLSFEEAASGLSRVGATTLDVSLAGLCIQSAHPLREGQRVGILALPSEDPCAKLIPKEAVARVVWVTKDHAGYAAGLRYV